MKNQHEKKPKKKPKKNQKKPKNQTNKKQQVLYDQIGNFQISP
jgi:hypothetical protein